MRDHLKYCPVCHSWHETDGAAECDRCTSGASLAVLFWWVGFAVVSLGFALWFALK